MTCRWVLPLTAVALIAVSACASADDFEDITVDIPQQCGAEFLPLRENARHLGLRIKEAAARHAPPKEACALIGQFHQAEVRMIRFAESRAAACQISPDLVGRLQAGGRKTEDLRKRVCDVARRQS